MIGLEDNMLSAGLQLVVTLVAVATMLWRFGLAQEQRLMQHMDSRYQEEKRAREQMDMHLRELLAGMESDGRQFASQLQQTQREMLELKAELPDRYVRREDYVRGQTLIESKLDALALRLEQLQLQRLEGHGHG